MLYFLWRHHLPCDKSENDRDSGSDWFTYCIDIWLLTLLFSFQYLSESCFGNNNLFLLPNPCIVLFFIYPSFYFYKLLFTQPFSLWCHPSPSINNDWSLKVAPYNFWNMTKSWFRFNFLKRGFLLEDKYRTTYIEQSSKSWKLFTKMTSIPLLW
jgi:hypothetical protein